MPGVLFLHPEDNAALEIFPLSHDRYNFWYSHHHLFSPGILVILRNAFVTVVSFFLFFF